MSPELLYPVVALCFLLLAVWALTGMKGRGRRRKRSWKRSGRSWSRSVAHQFPFDRKETAAERKARPAAEFRRYQKDHPGATRMPVDYYHQPPPPSRLAALARAAGRWVKAQTWGRAVTWVRDHTNPF